uniref:Uncharacterized protein n=1 Tax=Panagrellus redivivus TaxID=6233 RepID=A0A7E4V5Y6_PANRE
MQKQLLIYCNIGLIRLLVGCWRLWLHESLTKNTPNKAFELCSKQADNVPKHAHCVSMLLKNEFPSDAKPRKMKVRPKLTKPTTAPPRFKPVKTQTAFVTESDESTEKQNRFNTVRRLSMPSKGMTRIPLKAFSRFERLRHRRIRRAIDFDDSKYGFPKMKIIQRDRYSLAEDDTRFSPLSAIAKSFTETLMSMKNKTYVPDWKQSVVKLRNVAKSRKNFEIQEAKDLESDPNLTPFEKHLTKGLKKPDVDIEKYLSDPSKLQELAKQKRLEGKTDPTRAFLNLLRDGVKLTYAMTGKNASSLDEKTLKMVSPRFLSIMPEEDDDRMENLLSPSLFSLHNEGKGFENLTSLPSLIKTFSPAEQTQWLNLIMEAAGVNDQAEKLETDLEERQKMAIAKRNQTFEEKARNDKGQPLYFTKENVTAMYGDYEKRKIEHWEKLVATYSTDQLREMNETGYASLTQDQIHFLYGPTSPYNSSSTLERLSKVNSTKMQEYIESDVHKMAEMRNFRLKKRDIVLSPIISSPLVQAWPVMNTFIVLSPVVLSPVVLTPAVLGPVILSPWVFVPVILSPRVLSPLIVNPLIFSPIVLSPLVLHPLILSPGVFNPIVLSPLVLSPFILSPQVFTPLILSPMVLNPLILNPMVGSPLVLSPFVLSPLILSPQALFAVVLSPYTLSPLVASPLALAEVILSPSSLMTAVAVVEVAMAPGVVAGPALAVGVAVSGMATSSSTGIVAIAESVAIALGPGVALG